MSVKLSLTTPYVWIISEPMSGFSSIEQPWGLLPPYLVPWDGTGITYMPWLGIWNHGLRSLLAQSFHLLLAWQYLRFFIHS